MSLLRPTRAWLLGASLAGLAAALALLAFEQRASLRAQTLAREASTLHAITVWQRALEQERVGSLGLAAPDREFALLALAATRLPNVIAVETFTPDGQAASGVGAALGIAAPSVEDWAKLRGREPLARLLAGDEKPLEITVPLHEPDSPDVTGAVRFWIDSAAIRREFAAVDRRLAQQALLIWLVTGATLALVLALVFRQLARAEATLRARTEDLLHANRELAFAAKTSALGALAAHLVHGLRNPVAGLATLERAPAAESAETLREASAAARRIRQMVDDVVTILREEKSGLAYEVLPRELLDTVSRDVAELAAARGITLDSQPVATRPLDHRTAALASAILRNLARNAVEAAPERTGRVALRAAEEGSAWIFRIEDNGPGLPASVAARLFEPTFSSKADGAGIGLAICRQLALHLDAELAHEGPAAGGASFRLRVSFHPRSVP